MYVVLCGYHPFDPHGDSKDAEIVRRVLRAEYDFDDAAWGNVSREAQDLVSHLLVVDAAKRYDTNDVLRHPWMLRGISRGNGGWRIGAATTWTDILRAELPPAFDGLKAAAREVEHAPLGVAQLVDEAEVVIGEI